MRGIHEHGFERLELGRLHAYSLEHLAQRIGRPCAKPALAHERKLVQTGPYPYELKRRIMGRHGHLSNDDAGEVAAELARHGVTQVILGHLSKENNYPELALKCTEQALRLAGFTPGVDIQLLAAARDGCTGMFSVSAVLL